MYYDRVFTMRVSEVHLQQLKQVAEVKDISKSEALRQLIARAADEVKVGRPAPAEETA